jgi:hypothetical protein
MMASPVWVSYTRATLLLHPAATRLPSALSDSDVTAAAGLLTTWTTVPESMSQTVASVAAVLATSVLPSRLITMAGEPTTRAGNAWVVRPVRVSHTVMRVDDAAAILLPEPSASTDRSSVG